MIINLKNLRKGFTLIELLVVIAILGVLAAAVLVAINPLEQLARGRDAGRKTTVSQLGNAVQAYYTDQSAAYPTVNGTWITTLVTAGELKSAPSNPTGGGGYAITCAGAGVQNGICYAGGPAAVDAVVYVRAESNSDKIKSTGTGAACASVAWIVWSSAEGKTGLVCQAGDPAVGITGLR